MTSAKINKKIKIGIAAVAIIVTLGGVFTYKIFKNSSYNVSQIRVSSSLIDKVRDANKKGSVLELNNQELNQIISMYFKKEKTSEGLALKGANTELLNNSIKFYVPLSYKGINILLSTEGNLSIENNKIQYKPLEFKVGDFKLPMGYVMDNIKNHFKNGITVENNVICVDKGSMPLGIKSIEIKNNKLFLGLEKLPTSLEQKISDISSKLKSQSSELGSSSSNSNLNNTTNAEKQVLSKEVSAKENVSASSNTQKTASNSQNSAEKDAALSRISSGLSSAMGSVSTSGGRAVISQAMSVANNMQGNPSYNPYSASGGIKAAYSKLSPAEKAEVKSAVFSNVPGDAINTVNKIMGM